MVRVGLIGFGLAGQAFHAPVIRGVEGMELACVLERHTNNSKQRYPEVRVARTLDEMLSDKSINLIVVATPNDSHFSYSKTCLEAGYHVVVDKPLTPTLREAEQLARVAADRKRLFTVYQDRRWDGAFLTVKNLVHSGVLGTVMEYEARFDRFRLDAKPNAWREVADFPAAGVLWDLGPHLIDGALVLFGEPKSIWASAFCQRETATVDDAFDVYMEYPRTRVLLHARIIAYQPSHHLLLHGTAGSFVKYGMDPQESALKEGRTPDEPEWDTDPPELYGTMITSDARRTVPTLRSSFVRYYENMRDAMLGTAELAVSPEWSLDVMRGLVLAVQSSQTRRVLPWSSPA